MRAILKRGKKYRFSFFSFHQKVVAVFFFLFFTKKWSQFKIRSFIPFKIGNSFNFQRLHFGFYCHFHFYLFRILSAQQKTGHFLSASLLKLACGKNRVG
jgi:hypothetical protein